jgi:hypothetical protein
MTDAPNWITEQGFDASTNQRLFGGVASIMHCHHYLALIAQLADDATLFDGTRLLQFSAESVLGGILRRYYTEHSITVLAHRISLAEQYWQITGMGLLVFDCVGTSSARARMEQSQLDESWIEKFGRRQQPVNFVGQGYIAGALAAFYDLPNGSFRVTETASLVAGAPASRFAALRVA